MATNVKPLSKDSIQRFGLNTWWLGGNGKGTLEYATGVGKTRCGVLAANFVSTISDKPILILCPTRTIRDQVWYKEFKKWGYLELYESRVRMECIQTAYKWSDEDFGLVIVDEIHNTLTEEYKKFYENNKYDYILGLTATVPDRKRHMLNEIAPTVHKISVSQALKYKLVSPYRIFNVPIYFRPSEREEYNKYSTKIDELQEKGVQAFGLVSKRGKILHGAKNKLLATKEIVSWFPDKYGFVFAQYKKDVEEIAFAIGGRAQFYHGSLKSNVEQKIIDRFCDREDSINVLVSAKKLNEGADFPYVSFAIIHAGTSSDLVQTQQLGRIIRLEEGKQAILIRLYVPGTKDESWLRWSQYGMKNSDANITEVQSLEELKELLSDVV
jgi:superfamily II DNA or RNA helicase